MSQTAIRIAIVGCGNIAGPYVRDLAVAPEVRLAGVTDLDPARAKALADQVNCTAYATLDDLLADDKLDLVVNLTIHHAHAAVTTACLKAGKSVYSEKPLAMAADEARALVHLAESTGLRLGCSPFTALGEAQQTAWQCLRSGLLGQVRLAYAEVNWGRIESWHPEPAPFYGVGPLFDVGPYPLALLTTLLGPARQATAFGTVLMPNRASKNGQPFDVETPDYVTALLHMESGAVVRLTTNFYVSQNGRQGGIEFHGDRASLFLDSWLDPGSMLHFAEFGQTYRRIRLARASRHGLRWGTGVREMASAMLQGRPHRCAGDQAAHLVEVMSAITESADGGRPVPITSSFAAPEPLDWAR
jgi:predicted dehydrogenase